jgi:hypothetical protein
MKEFTYSYTLNEAMDGLFAADNGCTDSGIQDCLLKEAVKKYLRKLSKKNLETVIKEYCEQFLSEKKGYSEEDHDAFKHWIKDLL